MIVRLGRRQHMNLSTHSCSRRLLFNLAFHLRNDRLRLRQAVDLVRDVANVAA